MPIVVRREPRAPGPRHDGGEKAPILGRAQDGQGSLPYPLSNANGPERHGDSVRRRQPQEAIHILHSSYELGLRSNGSILDGA
jgi:hypothetical protein